MKKQHAINIRYKFVASIFLFVLLFLICHANVYAADIYIPEVLKDTYVYDSASILSNETEKAVNEKLDKLEEDTSAEIVVITIPSLNGVPIEDYANKEFNTLGIGKEETNNGVLLLISTEEPRVRIEVGKGLEWTLTDSISGRILDNHFVEYRANGDYDTAVSETVDAMAELIETEANREPGFVEKLNNEIARRWNSLSGFDKLCAMPMLIVAGCIAIFFLITVPFVALLVAICLIPILIEIVSALFVEMPVYVYYHILRKDKLPEYEARMKAKQEEMDKEIEKRKKREEENRKNDPMSRIYWWESSTSDSGWGSSSSSSSSSSWGSSSHSSGSFGGGSSGGGGASR